jgi:anti-anti-sigma factor
LASASQGNFLDVPLYSCKRCGWATAGSWREAVQGHGEGCSECRGFVELVPVGGRPLDTIAGVDRIGRPFEMRESQDLDGAVRLTLYGGLDIVVADRLTVRLQRLVASEPRVRVDLSELEFIDCSGLEALVDALARGGRLGRRLEVDRPVSAPVKRGITFLDASSLLWPADPERVYPPPRVIEGGVEAAADGGSASAASAD